MSRRRRRPKRTDLRLGREHPKPQASAPDRQSSKRSAKRSHPRADRDPLTRGGTPDDLLDLPESELPTLQSAQEQEEPTSLSPAPGRAEEKPPRGKRSGGDKS